MRSKHKTWHSSLGLMAKFMINMIDSQTTAAYSYHHESKKIPAG